MYPCVSTWTALGESWGIMEPGDRNLDFLSVAHKPCLHRLTSIREGYWGYCPPTPQVRATPIVGVLTICLPSSLPVTLQCSLAGLFAVSAAAALAPRPLKTQHTR